MDGLILSMPRPFAINPDPAIKRFQNVSIISLTRESEAPILSLTSRMNLDARLPLRIVGPQPEPRNRVIPRPS